MFRWHTGPGVNAWASEKMGEHVSMRTNPLPGEELLVLFRHGGRHLLFGEAALDQRAAGQTDSSRQRWIAEQAEDAAREFLQVAGRIEQPRLPGPA